MDKIVEKAVSEIHELEENVPEGKHIVTGDIRKLSSKLFRQIQDKRIENVFALCEELLEQRTWALEVIAYDFAYRVKKQYNDSTYDFFFHWLKDYVRGWGDCDDFCTHAFGELLRQKKSLFDNIIMWTENDLVLKGYGWMLKSLSKIEPHCVEEYLIANHRRMPRVAYRYALEKFDKETRNRLMKI